MTQNLYYRTWMFVPGNNPRMITKAQESQSDAIMLDIEDGVLPASKGTARENIHEALKTKRSKAGPQRYVRVNSVDQSDICLDLDAVVGPNLDGIVLPKVDSPSEVHKVDGMISYLEEQRHVEPGKVRLLVAIENAKGILGAFEIAAASKRTIGLILGSEDYSRDIGLPVHRKEEASHLVFARSLLVNAASAAGIQSVDGVWPDLEDQDALMEDSRRARNFGFTGKSIIHPKQIDAVNAAFTPTAADIEYAQRVLEAFKVAEKQGLGAVAFNGQLLDKPIVDRARAMVEQISRKS